LFKRPDEVAQEEFQKGYEKGINLGRAKWGDAVDHFVKASSKYQEAGMPDLANLSNALAWFYKGVLSYAPQDLDNCQIAMRRLGDSPVNLGMVTGPALEIADEMKVLSHDIRARDAWKAVHSQDHVKMFQDLAGDYTQLIGRDLVVWKVLGKTDDPQKMVQYYLGVSKFIEGELLVEENPEKTIADLNQSKTHMAMSGIDLFNIGSTLSVNLEKYRKVIKCWFCGRVVQAQDVNYVNMPARVTKYLAKKYGGDTPPSSDTQEVYACANCYTSIYDLSDQIARRYFDEAMREISRLDSRIDEVNSILVRLDSRLANLERYVRNLASSR
jgi:hypothetical protein